ncbi:host attachment protein [Devosia neptuniae]|jgi:protein required for attachment to host cells|uniref:host attachment protein n=1 Tax=Devosia TaxID=46913 RepID=UPI0022AEE196|nr:host attachment protein [Devosia neptuniae]MCZ4345755.1 host attachment protein [Devosia neptuniae]|tara:strand:- start:53643 stop:54092 length:450 start_codon:yes stop_codon:yes gene_type:complete
MKKTVTWVLIADGAQARVLENTGPGKGLQQVQGQDWAMPNMQAQDIQADKPGRSFSSSGSGRSAMEPRTDPVEHRETEFVKSLANNLDRKLQDGAFDRLIIVAAPIALGDIRKAISPNVKKTVMAELDKDLTNLPTAQLTQHLNGVIAL